MDYSVFKERKDVYINMTPEMEQAFDMIMEYMQQREIADKNGTKPRILLTLDGDWEKSET